MIKKTKVRNIALLGALIAITSLVRGAEFPPEGCPEIGAATVDNPLPLAPGSMLVLNPDGQHADGSFVLTGGKLFIAATDVEVPAAKAAGALRFSRYYSNQDGFSGVLGTGWVTILDMRLIETFDETSLGEPDDGAGEARRNVSLLILREETGNLIFLRELGKAVKLGNAATAARWKGDGYSASRSPDGMIEVYRPNQTMIRFSASGQPQALRDRNGNEIAFSYDGSHVLELQDNFGGALKFEYGDDGRLDRVIDNSSVPSRVWTYRYDHNRQLSSVISPDGKFLTYEHSDQADMANITGIVPSSGAETHFAYQDNGGDRVAKVSASSRELAQLEFNPWLGTSEVKSGSGDEWNYEYQHGGEISLVIDPSKCVWVYRGVGSSRRLVRLQEQPSERIASAHLKNEASPR